METIIQVWRISSKTTQVISSGLFPRHRIALYPLLRGSLLFLLLQSFYLSSLAQNPPLKAEIKDRVFRSWNNQNGLPQNTVYDIVQDQRGYLWGATEEGLFRFDGAEFNIINTSNTPGISSSIFYDLLPSGKYIWASGRDFLLRISDRVDKIIKLPEIAYGGWIKCIEMDNRGRLWVGASNGGVYYLEGDSIHVASGWDATSRLTIETLLSSPEGMMIGTSKGLFRMKDIQTPSENITYCGDAHILSLALGANGRVWAGTAVQGLYSLGRQDSLLLNAASGLNENGIFSLYVSGKERDSVWIGFRSRGIQLLYQDKLMSVSPGQYDHEVVRSIYTTPGGLVWLGTNSSGLIQMKAGMIRTAPSFTGLANKVILPVYEQPNGDVWVGTAGRGAYHISGDQVKQIDQANGGLTNDLVLSIQGSGKYIYIGTSNGLNRYNLHTKKIDRRYSVADGLVNNWIISVFAAADGKVWITTRVGGLHYLGADGSIVPVSLPSEVGRPNLIGIYEDKKNNLWFGTRGAGMITMSANGSITHHNQARYPADVVYDFWEDEEGDMWMATDKGMVVSYKGVFKVIDKKSGLLFNEVYRLLHDPSGYIWMSGNLGLQRLAVADMVKVKKLPAEKAFSLAVQLFNDYDGMPNAETNGGFFPAGWAMKDGTLWFPTVNGVAVADYRRVIKVADPLKILIQSLRYGDNEYFPDEQVSISPGVLNFEVRYTCVDFSKASDIRYYYRVKGYNNEWASAGNRHVAFFSALPPGQYTFEVKAERYGEWSPVASLKFRIHPHFYQTTWFNILVRALFISAVILIIYSLRRRARRKLQQQQRLNLAQINGQEKERQFISKELHDNVNQQLSTAKIYLNYLQTNPGKREDLLAKSEEVVQKAINEIRQLCNALTPPGLKDIGLKEALEDLVNSYTVVGNVKIYLDFDERIKDIDEDLQFVIYRITQEALNNVVRHSQADTVWLQFEYTEPLMQITVKDNGRGFDPRMQKPGVGFENIRNRLNLYNGKLEVKAAPGKGCTLVMQLQTGASQG